MQKPSTRLCLATCAGAALVVALTIPAHAHHGWGGNSDDESQLTGTVEMLSVAGPHATMRINVDGQVWDITLGPPARTQRAGLQNDSIPIGSTVTLTGHRNKTAGRFEMKTEQVVFGDRLFNVYPDRH
jgi:hypothetical protein